ncbi:MAG: peptidylprolyl isomerase [Lachnospiraceae bacterium]|nr:peptidylprolyl isomerase [Robinsoniella sp.]MDY3766559.1 peptidylprolyl isomerase [Lachnospiraceae bacterium]
MDVRQLIAFVITVLLAGLVVSKCSKNKGKISQDGFSAVGSLSGRHHVQMRVKDYGTMVIELDADNAPVTVTNFVGLVRRGFYNGLTFHRVIDGFMIQGGDPNHDGTGGSEQRIVGEFPDNGAKNPLLHKRGAISMARSGDMNSASSQFFIVQRDCEHLDGSYAVFGHVTEGMEIVDQICAQTPIQDNNGAVAREDQPVIEEIKILD